MSDKVLIDTNVLVYAYDRREPLKQERAIGVLDRLATTARGFLSTQVLAEFFWVTTTKLPDPLTVEEAGERVGVYLRCWSIEPITSLIVLEAVRGVREHHLSFWDAQIWATALLTQSNLVVSEDFQNDSIIEGIRFLSPFTRQFEFTQLG